MFLLQTFVDVQCLVDPHVPVGVNAQLPVGPVSFAGVLVQFFFVHHNNAVVIGATYVGFRQRRGALGDGAVAGEFHAAYPNPLVPEAGTNPGGH